MMHVAEMRDLSRPAVGIDRVAEAIAADAGVRMNLAVLADLAAGADENMRMQYGARADLRVVLDRPCERRSCSRRRCSARAPTTQ